MNAILEASLIYAPARLRTYVEAERLRTRLRERRRGVPAAPFRELVRAGLTVLMNRIGAANLGDYLEFGVYNGTSLVAAFRQTEAMGLSHMRLFGFDSFQGLPAAAATDDEGVWKPGAWRSEEGFTRAVLASEGVDDSRVTLVPGWFSETCTEATSRQYNITKASVIMVDCDIYTSTREALCFCAPLIRDHALLIFDDWHAGGLAARGLGERRAFEEWLAASGSFSREPIGSYSRNSEAFIVTRVDQAGDAPS